MPRPFGITEMWRCPVQEPFDDAWPVLAERLRRSLAARRVPAQDRDDVVQETALRVYRVWDTLDHDRSVWPFVITVAVNIWRDVMRERVGRIAQVQPSADIEATAELDVERDVLAREELANVRIAIRALAPEQRRLLLATEEFADTVRPLRPAERVARMRVRRQLARAVGRASAAVAVLWLRRPARTTGLVATAFAGTVAATVLTAPVMVPMPAITALPPAHRHVLGHDQPTTSSNAVPRADAAAAGRPTITVPPSRRASDRLHASTDPRQVSRQPQAPVRTRVCSPAGAPLDVLSVVVRIGSLGSLGTSTVDGSGRAQSTTQAAPTEVRSAKGCVAVR